MDESVLRAMVKWPNVPNVHGWLSLTRRGEWRLRGERIGHAGLAAFIARNYQCDERGAWYFQNGPQRVFVTLECAPLVFRIVATEPLQFEAQEGSRWRTPEAVWLDDDGTLYLQGPRGPGNLDDRDLAALCPSLEDAGGRSLAVDGELTGAALWLVVGSARLPVLRISNDEVPERLGFIREPALPCA